MDLSIPKLPDLAAVMKDKNNPAGYMLERLSKLIAAFQHGLSEDVEIAMLVAGAGTIPFRLRGVRVSNPDILIFNGIDEDGNPVQLVQHHSQMSVMLTAVPKLEETPYRIGFTAG